MSEEELTPCPEIEGQVDTWEEAVKDLDDLFHVSGSVNGPHFLQTLSRRLSLVLHYGQSNDYARHFCLVGRMAAGVGYNSISTLSRHLYLSNGWPYSVASVASYQFFLADIFRDLEVIKAKFLESGHPHVQEIVGSHMETFSLCFPYQIPPPELKSISRLEPAEIAQSKFSRLAERIVSGELYTQRLPINDFKLPDPNTRPFMTALIDRVDETASHVYSYKQLHQKQSREVADMLEPFQDIYRQAGVSDIRQLVLELDR